MVQQRTFGTTAPLQVGEDSVWLQEGQPTAAPEHLHLTVSSGFGHQRVARGSCCMPNQLPL
jgi:hypothetical protein